MFSTIILNQECKQSWNYIGEMKPSRKLALEQAPSWTELVEEIHKSMKVMCVHEEPSIKCKGAFRFRYCIEISDSLFDQFFNSHTGYRAGYFMSTEIGLSRNSHFINTIIPKLQKAAALSSEHSILLSKAYSFPSSKVWLTEVQKKKVTEEINKCPKCITEWPNHKQSEIVIIDNGRWQSSHNSIGANAFPYTKLWIFSAFIHENGTEWVPEEKKDRAKEIHETGWS